MLSGSALKEYIRKFDEEHGGTEGGVFDITKGEDEQPQRIYFPDGAWRSVDPSGISYDGSPDPVERAATVVLYWKLRVEHATKAFNDKRSELVAHAKAAAAEKFAPAPIDTPANAERTLKQLRDAAKKAQRALTEAQENLDELKGTSPRTRESKQRESQWAANRQANADLLVAVEKIKL